MTARARVAALLILADRAMTAHVDQWGFPTQHLATSRLVERVALGARRDGLADAYRTMITADLGDTFAMLDHAALIDHAQQQVRVEAVQ